MDYGILRDEEKMEKFVIAVDLGGTNIRGALVDEKGRFVAQCSKLTPAVQGRDAVIEQILLVIDQLKKENKKVCGIGIGTPGIIDYATGSIIGASPNIVDWPGTPLGSILREKYHLPVEVDNDVNAITLGEFYGHSEKKLKNFACIVLGTGVGIGIVLNGDIFKNAHELGHMSINFDGPKCGCGRQGCVEAFCSGTWIVSHYCNLIGGKVTDSNQRMTAGEVFDQYQKGDTQAKKVVEDFINGLASGMANIILAFSITDFVITGGVSRSFHLFQEQLLAEVHKRSISHLNSHIMIRQGTFNDQSGILGMASLIFKKIG